MSDYLTDEEQMARLQSWWQTNGTWLLAAVVAAVLLVLGWRWYQSQQAATVAAASDQYAAYLAADEQAQPALGASLIAEYPDSTYAAFVRMRNAKAAADEGDYAQAISALEALLASGPEAVVGDLARLRLARLMWQQEKADVALGLLGDIRSAGFRSQVAELKGDILFQQGDRAGANEAYTAALAELGATEERPILQMKKINTATENDARTSGSSSADEAPAVDSSAQSAGDVTPAGSTAAEAVTDVVEEATGALENAVDAADEVELPNAP